MAIRVLIADDHQVVRAGLALLIKQTPGLTVVGEADNGRSVISMVESLKPDVIVMDIGMPELSGPEATRQILGDHPDIRILSLSAYSDRGHVLAALRAGAAGYLVKDCAVNELVDAIQTVARGERYISSSLSREVIGECIAGSSREDGAGRLTAREREVLQLLAEGKAMKQVGQVLHISTKTVETHRRSVMEKLQLFSTAELTKHAVREGLTSLY